MLTETIGNNNHTAENGAIHHPEASPKHKSALMISLTREQAIETTCKHLVAAGILLPGEVPRYQKLLESYDNPTLIRVMICSKELREEAGDIFTGH